LWCALLKTKVTSPFFIEEPTMTGLTFLAMIENTALHCVSVGTVFQLDGAPPHFSHHVHAFLDRDFTACWIQRRRLIPWPPHSPDLTPLDFFSWVFVKDILYCEKCKMCIFCMTELSEQQSVLPMKCLPTHGKKLNIILLCVVPQMELILKSTEHIKNVVRSIV
jgi:hypothetical protein